MKLMQIDADFIAQYQMNYGCGGDTTETDASVQYSDDYWSNPPADINSEEYRIWYERYCSYFYPQTLAAESVTSSSVEAGDTVGPDALSGSINGTAVNSTTVTASDVERPADTTSDAVTNNASGKKRKKSKKDDVANPKPVEPPGEPHELPVTFLSSMAVDDKEDFNNKLDRNYHLSVSYEMFLFQ